MAVSHLPARLSMLLDRTGVALSAPSTVRVSLPVLGVQIWLVRHTGGNHTDPEIYLWPTGGPTAAMVTTSVVLATALRLEPWLATIEFGQINLILMVLVAVDCFACQPRWPRGLLVGIAAAIKLTPAAFVLFFLNAPRPRCGRERLDVPHQPRCGTWAHTGLCPMMTAASGTGHLPSS